MQDYKSANGWTEQLFNPQDENFKWKILHKEIGQNQTDIEISQQGDKN